MSENSTKSFVSLIQEIDLENRVNRDRGTLFELLTKTYLENEPIYQRLFDTVWMLNDVPIEYNIPKIDTGVDLVARKAKTGELVAIQCKYYSKDTRIRKEHIDSFLNELGKNYYDEGLIITTTDKWSKNADEALIDRNKPIMRISLSQLKESIIDWSQYSFSKPEDIVLQERKSPRAHQIPAINAVLDGFRETDRGKLIMAPGTGKTYTSMAIAEKLAEESKDSFKVLYLVPSIQLLSQTLRSWNADIKYNMDSIAVCSDRKVTKERIGTEIEDIATSDIGFPATTNKEKLIEYQETIESRNSKPEFISVFSTYQSIDVIMEAQKEGFYDFDLIICDEAHRTTGLTELNKEASAFTKVHYNENVKAKKRLYQTATPRVYGEDAKVKAEEKSVIIADMNDSSVFGEELYRIGFGDAIRKGILTDYKVMVLAVEEDIIARRFQNMFANTESGLQFDDVTKIIGCWNGLVKRDGKTNKTLGQPMKRAIAFTGTISDSKKITDMFSTVVDEYLYDTNDLNTQFKIDIKHADGTMNAIEKNEKIDWLKSEVPDNTCRVLSNARFLTEGVDVPDLDAVMFLKPRKSKIDIAQAVGRVMRKAEGKEYGYIILPIGIPAGSDAHSILDNNEKYAVVWEILNALRSIDERFDAVINKIELNNKKPNKINIIGVGDAPESGTLEEPSVNEEQLELDLSEESLSDLEKAIYGKIVNKVGNVRYWEQWSEKVAEIAQLHITRINVMLEDQESRTYKEFQSFMQSMRHNINDSISESQAIEMLAQHLITKPVFEALFETYSFVNNNPVSQAMESILELLDKNGLVKEQEGLEDFYESVRIRAEGIDNLKAKQNIIVQLYNKFFKVGFKNTTTQLGIVFTPVEVVDFIIHSVNDIIKEKFGKSLSSDGVHVLDPFTGTGTFITRLLQSGVISKENLLRKYTQEIHANEIVLLSYYIAAINIEETFHSIYGDSYVPFEGIVLTDTFDSTENRNSFSDELFNENNKRLKRQIDKPIFAIIGNPPYFAKQDNDNKNIQSQKYENLDKKIAETYVKNSVAQNKANQYDSYIRAIRWSTDRIGDNEGIVGFITNGSFLDSPSADGLRYSLYKEYDEIHVYNLRGAIRGKSGESAKKEGQNIFDIMTGVAIIILVKTTKNNKECKLYYKDIGDNLKRNEKLEILEKETSIINTNSEIIIPNEKNDWINQRNSNFDELTLLGNKKASKNKVFNDYSGGLKSGRDNWVYSFSKEHLIENMTEFIDYYNSNLNKNIKSTDLEDSSKIKWTKTLRDRFDKNIQIKEFNTNRIYTSVYRPFTKKHLYYDSDLIDRQYQMSKIFPDSKTNNLTICFSNKTGGREFSCLITNTIPDVNLFAGGSQCLPYQLIFSEEKSIIEDSTDSGITQEFKNKCYDKYGSELTDDEIFYYVYGVLHSEEYKVTYHIELSKEFPRVPLVDNYETFQKISGIGERLAYLHLNYEEVETYKEVNIEYKVTNPSYNINQIKFKKNDKSTLIYNNDIVISNIPELVYEYKVNGRSALEWIINQYNTTPDPQTGISDPNLYSSDDKYILNLILSIINVSLMTLELIKDIPTLNLD